MLNRHEGDVVIFIDEIESFVTLPFSTDEIFGSIRVLSNLQADDAECKRLTFCLLGVATPGALIRDPLRTSFNIGRAFLLRDFSRRELDQFSQGLRHLRAETSAFLDEIYAWTAGHPYMTHRLCKTLVEGDREGRLLAEWVSSTALATFTAIDANLEYAERRLDSHPRATEMLALYERLPRRPGCSARGSTMPPSSRKPSSRSWRQGVRAKKICKCSRVSCAVGPHADGA